jgi:hypothetical protein
MSKLVIYYDNKKIVKNNIRPSCDFKTLCRDEISKISKNSWRCFVIRVDGKIHESSLTLPKTFKGIKLVTVRSYYC